MTSNENESNETGKLHLDLATEWWFDCLMPDHEFEIKKEQINALHRIETWGLSLFVAGIAIMTKQLFDWENSDNPVIFPIIVKIAPVLTGLYGSAIVIKANERNRKLRSEISDSKEAKKNLEHRGELGNWLAFMPFLFGIACALFLLYC